MIFWYKPWKYLKGNSMKAGGAYVNLAVYGAYEPFPGTIGALVRGTVIVTPYIAEENLAAEVEIE